ncbi:MAG: hypothetical protein RMK20_01205 [Verrucomicrobiales bacterium]|nr:hypothetical protein [Verrucomicrobiales bacterium]
MLTNGAPLDVALAVGNCAARFNPVTRQWSAVNLTTNGFLDRSPALSAATNGTALVVWIQNTNNSVLGASNAPNTIRSLFWNGSAWQNAGVVATNVGMVLWSTLAFNGMGGLFLATIDADSDQSTTGDQELWGAIFYDPWAGWGPFTRFTQNALADTKPQCAFDGLGRLVTTWHQASNVVMWIDDLDFQNPTVVGSVGDSSSAKDFKLVTGPAGQISIVWEDLAADGTGPDPMLLNYDPTLRAWSQPLRLLTNTNQLERSFSGAYAPDGALLLAYNRVDVRPDTNGVPQFGAVDLMFLDYRIGNDLAVNSANQFVHKQSRAGAERHGHGRGSQHGGTGRHERAGGVF